MDDATKIADANRKNQHGTSYDKEVVIVDDEVPRAQINALLSNSLFNQEVLHAQWRRAMMVNAHERLAMVNLWTEGSLSMSELGSRIPLSRAAITSLTDRLERLGYVQRLADPNDRRRTVLKITDRAASVVGPLTREYSATMQAIAEEMDDDEWAAVTKFLRRVTTESREASAKIRGMDDDTLMALIDEGQRRG
ncbi:MAG: MarR family transcriptional regulator [Thermoleophilia bacterium]|nr:MarR family transcriptional regulator [Thermoleophilia bacterium]